MSSAAVRAAEEADAVLASVLGQTNVLSAVQKVELLTELAFKAEAEACEQDVAASIANAEEVAAGNLGDRVKYAAAVRQQAARWRLFAAMMNLADDCEPTLELMDKYAAFMYTCRARQSSSGRAGLGDGACKMAQHTLAQVSKTAAEAACCVPEARCMMSVPCMRATLLINAVCRVCSRCAAARLR